VPAYVLLDIEVKNAEAYARYRELGPPAVAAHGGRYLVRGGNLETLEGTWRPSRFVLLEFPTMEAARAWWASSEYAAAKALRQASTRTRMILVEGVPGDPG
jgi:uncharacterized protein (DUF1330 family)